jgi:hypothetical protein
MAEDITPSNPRIHLENIRSQEQVLLEQLKEKERELRILLTELKALRNLKKQATDQIEETSEFEAEEEILRRKKEREEEHRETTSIDELVDEVKTAQSSDQPYQSGPVQQPYVGENQIDQVARGQTLEELNSIMYNPNPTAQDREKLLAAANTVVRLRSDYDLGTNTSAQVEKTYETIKNIIEQRPDLVSDYSPSSNNSPVSQFIDKLKNNSVNEYKL